MANDKLLSSHSTNNYLLAPTKHMAQHETLRGRRKTKEDPAWQRKGNAHREKDTKCSAIAEVQKQCFGV